MCVARNVFLIVMCNLIGFVISRAAGVHWCCVSDIVHTSICCVLDLGCGSARTRSSEHQINNFIFIGPCIILIVE